MTSRGAAGSVRSLSRALIDRLRAQAVPLALLVLILGCGAALRLDAITQQYGPVTSPKWLQTLQKRAGPPLRAIRPARIQWDPALTYPHRDGPPTHYSSDPYTYLLFARQMQSFSAAHFREPLFPFVTKVFLKGLRDQDVAVSFTSASFSMLMILAAYLLGAGAFSTWVGLGAAFALAIEYDVILWDTVGWRDGAFACAVVLCAWAMVRYARAPSWTNAVGLGVLGGLACLLRITSLSFLLPGFAYLGLAAKPRNPRALALGLLVMTLVIAPYIVNCWRVYGDPLYAINYHTRNYLAVEGRETDDFLPVPIFRPPPLDAPTTAGLSPTAVSYVGAKALSRPFQTLDTVALGLTAYPFQNKWKGLDRWVPGAGTWVSWAALGGLVLFVANPAGRLLLLILATSLLPFAVTWKLVADWRYTEHAYPFYLIAACLAIHVAVLAFRPSHVRERLRQGRRLIRPIASGAAVLCGIALAVWIVGFGLPVLTLRESLLAHEEATITAGDRDGLLFAEGWSTPSTGGNVRVRVSTGAPSVIRIPLPRVEDYYLTLRLNPVPRPADGETPNLPALTLFMNGRAISSVKLRWDPARVGSYDVKIPRDAVTTGINRLALVVDRASFDAASPGPSTFDLWYLRIRPSSMPAVPSPAMALDMPTNATVVSANGPFIVAGWAIDRGAPAGSGVTAVHAYAYPVGGAGVAGRRFLGEATLGAPRPDVGAVFGGQFAHAGFNLTASGLDAGAYHVAAYALSSVSRTFNQVQFTDITVTPPVTHPAIVVDAPAPGIQSQPFTVGGWAVDTGAPAGTGIDAVRVLAVPTDGRERIALGDGGYGGARPDVGKAIGARYTNSGYTLIVRSLPAGRTYDIIVEARSTVTAAITASTPVRIAVK